MVLSSTLLALTVHANSISVPEIGSAGASGITIELEREYGNYYMAVAKGTVQSYDPVLNEYINSIGQKLVLHAANVKFPLNSTCPLIPHSMPVRSLAEKFRLTQVFFITPRQKMNLHRFLPMKFPTLHKDI